MPQKHCTDQELLAYLDHELTPDAMKAVAGHVSACWQCRARAGELENQIYRLVQLFANGMFPNRSEVSIAKARFASWREEFDSQNPPSVEFSSHTRAMSPFIAASLVAMLIAFVSIWFWFPLHPSAAVLLARAEEAERIKMEPAAVVHETYQIELTQSSSPFLNSQGKLEVWSQPKAERFAWRWRDDANRLRFAEWKPDGGERYTFNGQGHSSVFVNGAAGGRHSSLIEAVAPATTIDHLNTAFVAWIESQHWRLISIAADFALFSNRAGTDLATHHEKDPNGRSLVVLEAAATQGNKRLTLILKIDEATARPVAEVARVIDQGQAFEVRIVARHFETLRAVPTLLAVFRPDFVAADSRSPAPVPPIEAFHGPAKRKAVDPALLESLEIQVLYILHRQGLCLGAPILVSQDERLKVVRVSGLIATPEAKLQLISAISAIGSGGLVRTELKTFDEAAIDSRQPHVPSSTGIEDASADGLSVLAIENLIENGSLPDSEKALLKRRMVSQSAGIISHAGALVRESWALQHLLERFSESRIQQLPAASRQLIAKMASDHLKALKDDLAEVDTLVEPLHLLVGAIRPWTTVPESTASADDGHSNSTFAALLTTANQLNDNAQALFALGEQTSNVHEKIILELLQSLQQFNRLLDKANEKCARIQTPNAPLDAHVDLPTEVNK